MVALPRDKRAMMANDLEALLELTHELADASGQAIRPWFRSALAADNKSSGFDDYSPVTRADKDGEAAIRRILDARVPSHRIVGEEMGIKEGDEWTWFLDPVDGTRGFLCGLHSWGTLIGLTHREEPVIGMVDQPITQERWWASPAGAFVRFQGQTYPLKTRTCSRLEDAIVCCTHPSMVKGSPAFQRLAERVRMVRYGTDCMGYAMLASGQVDLVVERGLEPHDVVAHYPVVERAGGRLTDWSGNRALTGGAVVASGDPSLHERVLSVLQGP